MGKVTFVHPLGLGLAEWRLIRDCMHAWTLVPNGHYLPAQRWKKAAERLIARGYLTRAEAQMSPPNDWIVVVITKDNVACYNRDLRKVALLRSIERWRSRHDARGAAG
jgi:hypothetical protein